MFERPFLPQYLAAAAVDGSVAVRPAPGLPSPARPSAVAEPLVKPTGAPGLDAGPDPGGDSLDDGDDRRRPTATVSGSTADLSSDLPADDPATDPAIADLVAAAPIADLAGDLPIAEGTAVSPDITGYGAYGNTPGPGLGMSRDQLVQRYAHLVKYVVGRLGVSVPGLFDHEDAMQAGVLGLLRAIDAYKPEAAASFESYAILRIRGSILDAVRSLDTVGRAGREAARAIQGVIRDLQHEMGRSPTESEIAARLGMPVARYRERLQAASVVTVSLDEHEARDHDDDSGMLADNAPDPNAVDPEDEATRRDAIAGLIQEIGRLAQRPRMVLALYYQDEMTFKEIGQVLGVTESRVCQIHTEAILALRTKLVDPDVAARLGRRRARS
jgi:RNA polymerase sigma factor FliA